MAALSLSVEQYQQVINKYLQAASEWPSCRQGIKEQLLITLSHVTDNLNLAHAPSHTAQTYSSCNSGVSNATGDHKLTPDQLLFSQLSESMCSMFADHADVMTMLGVKCLDEGVYNQAEFFFRGALVTNRQGRVSSISLSRNRRPMYRHCASTWRQPKT